MEKIRAAFEDAGVDFHSHLWLENEGELNRTLSKTKLARPFIDLLRRTAAAEVRESYESNPVGHQNRREYRAEIKCEGWTLQGILEPKFHEGAAGVAEIFRRAGAPFRERREGLIDAGRLKVMAAIEACRTAVLGGHIYRCDGCGREHPPP